MDYSKERAKVQKRNYTPLIWILTVVMVLIILGVNYIPRSETGTLFGMDLTILPLFNAIINGVSLVFLIISFVYIRKKNIKMHRRFIYAALTTTFLFLISYLTYHALSGSTSYGGTGFLAYLYYFILITHILLAMIVLPLVMITLARGLNMEVEKHRKIARITMPIWIYVTITGILVYILISPYY